MPLYDLHLTVEMNAWYSVDADTVEEAVAAVDGLSLHEVMTDDTIVRCMIDQITTEDEDGLEHAVDFVIPEPAA